MPLVSVILPVYNVEKFVAQAIDSVLAQRFEDFELVIVNDKSPDGSREICASYTDPRVRIIDHRENRGLAGARNTGIRQAKGEYLAFLDSDDFWHADKLKAHVEHLDANPQVGISFSRSAFVSEDGEPLGIKQMPMLTGITTKTLMCRNPIGNGSAPVIRKQVLDDIGWEDNLYGEIETFYFDDNFRQSEDIECWIRIKITTNWKIEGLTESLTYYRLNSASLSANTEKQLASWEAVIEKTASYAPQAVKEHGQMARSYQYRYLARQSIRTNDGHNALKLSIEAIRMCPRILIEEPGRTILTVVAAVFKKVMPEKVASMLVPLGISLTGMSQNARIRFSRS